MTPGRRSFLIVGGIIGTVYRLRAVPWDRFPGRRLNYVAIDGLPPFRALESGGQVSSGSAAFIGLDPPDGNAAARRARAEAVKADLCSALFGADISQDAVPIAYFSEFRCPYCRALERNLGDILTADPTSVRLVQHELPIFGPPSELAARASVAAARQRLQQPLRQRFKRTSRVADEPSVLAVAATVGLDTEQLRRAMRASEVQAERNQTRALADLFGTPGLVIGRTVVIGAVPASLLKRIIADEWSMAPKGC